MIIINHTNNFYMSIEKPVPPENNTEKFNRERVKEFLPQLKRFHDLFEDRSVVRNSKIANFLAKKFGTAGIEVFEDFASVLRETYNKQIKEGTDVGVIKQEEFL